MSVIQLISFDLSGTLTWCDEIAGETEDNWIALIAELKPLYRLMVTTSGEINIGDMHEIKSKMFKAKTHCHLRFNTAENKFDIVEKAQETEAEILFLTKVPKDRITVYPLVAAETNVPLTRTLFVDDGMGCDLPLENFNVFTAREAGALGMHYAGNVRQLRQDFVKQGLLPPLLV